MSLEILSLHGIFKLKIIFLLRERHDLTTGNPDKDDFAVMTMAEAIDLYDTIFGALNLLLVALAEFRWLLVVLVL